MAVVSFRRALPGDVDFLFSLVTHDEVAPFLAAGRASDREALLAEIERSAAEPEAFGRFVIEVDGQPAGSMRFERVNERSRIAQLGGLAVHPDFRGRGVADDAARQLSPPPRARARLPPPPARDLRLQRASDGPRRAGRLHTGRSEAQGVPATRARGSTASSSASSRKTLMREPCAHEHSAPLRTALLCGLAGGALSAAIQLPFIGRYGWDRDELYFLSAARRPALGYVDFPPLTAWVAWLVRAVAGDSLVALRLTCLAAGIAVIVLIALMVRELGGGWRAQLGAGARLGAAPGRARLGQHLPPDLVRPARVGRVPLRRAAGARPAGAAAVARARPRRRDRARGEVHDRRAPGRLHDRAARDPVEAPARDARAVARARRRVPRLPAEPRLAGAARLAERPLRVEPERQDRRGHLARRLRRPGAVLPRHRRSRGRRGRDRLALAASAPASARDRAGRGDAPLPRRARAELLPAARRHGRLRGGDRRSRRLAACGAPGAATRRSARSWPSSSPFWPWRRRSSCRCARPRRWSAPGPGRTRFYKDELGWPELADQTARAWRGLPAADRSDGAVLAANYGEASALERYGPARGLPLVVSGHLSWQYWRPRRLDAALRTRRRLRPAASSARSAASWRTLAHIDNRWHIANEERGRTIVACSLRRPLGELWRAYIARDAL